MVVPVEVSGWMRYLAVPTFRTDLEQSGVGVCVSVRVAVGVAVRVGAGVAVGAEDHASGGASPWGRWCVWSRGVAARSEVSISGGVAARVTVSVAACVGSGTGVDRDSQHGQRGGALVGCFGGHRRLRRGGAGSRHAVWTKPGCRRAPRLRPRGQDPHGQRGPGRIDVGVAAGCGVPAGDRSTKKPNTVRTINPPAPIIALAAGLIRRGCSSSTGGVGWGSGGSRTAYPPPPILSQAGGGRTSLFLLEAFQIEPR